MASRAWIASRLSVVALLTLACTNPRNMATVPPVKPDGGPTGGAPGDAMVEGGTVNGDDGPQPGTTDDGGVPSWGDGGDGKCLGGNCCDPSLPCPGGFVCGANNTCTTACPASQISCGGKCVTGMCCDPTIPCPGGFLCGANNMCTNTCPGSQFPCGGKCVSGQCCDPSVPCPGGFVCGANNMCTITCPGGQIPCGGGCVTGDCCTSTPPRACPGGFVCGANNRCTNTCPDGTVLDGGACVPCGGPGQLCCSGNSCSNAMLVCASDNHCAAKKSLGAACSSATECATNICGGRCCAVPCTCPQPNAKNVLKNAGIDQDVTGWIPSQGSAVYSTSDSEGCPFSGSMQITIPAGMEFTVSECVPAPLAGTFNFGASVNTVISGGLGLALCAADFFSGFACDRDMVTMQETASSASVSGWQRITGQVGVPGANSVKLECFLFADTMSQTTIALDELFVTAVPGLY